MTIVWCEHGKYYRYDTNKEFDSRVSAFAYIVPPSKKTTKARPIKSRKKK